MADGNGVLKSIAWKDIFPCWLLLRVFRQSVSPSVLLLSTAASLLTPLGWWCAEVAFLPARSEGQFAGSGFAPDDSFRGVTAILGRSAVETPASVTAASPWWSGELLDRPLPALWQATTSRTRAVYSRFVFPFRQLLTPGQPLTHYAYLLFGVLWTLGIWALFGGAITRIAAVRFGPEQRVGLVEALNFARRRLLSYFAAPLFPLLAVVVLVALCLPLGLLMRLEVGEFLAGFVWPLVLLAALLMGLLLVGLTLGWPLMWPTISCEESGDVFEATQRCYSYTFDRPLNYLCYAAVAAVLGGLGWIVVLTFSEVVIGLGFWATAWGAGPERIEAIATPALVGNPTGEPVSTGAFLIGLACGLVRVVATSYVYAYFWCAATAVYLLMRMDVDQTELDEVFEEEDQERTGLPPLHLDSAGVPGLDEAEPGPDADADPPAP